MYIQELGNFIVYVIVIVCSQSTPISEVVFGYHVYNDTLCVMY